MNTYTPVTFDKVNITDGFWAQKQRLVREVSLMNVYKRFSETGRFAALDFAWKEGDPNKPHIFWDSDIAKWLESAAYLIEKSPAPELEAIVDSVVDKIEAHQAEDGYYNICFQMFEPENRFTRRTDHELYCAGHLIEAAVAYHRATGKDKFLKLMCRYADLIERVFKIERSAKFATPGHEEIELALVKLAHATGERRYLDLAKFFIDERGANDLDVGMEYVGRRPYYSQSHAPCREQTTAEGHSVRAVYLYSGMADVAREYSDESLKAACETLWKNITTRRMYVTGGIGSAADGEQFTTDYDLPNEHAYSESCAALGLALFARRMLELDPNADYADVIERVIYNGFLSSISLDGKSFFYENPLEVDMSHHRRNEALGQGHLPPPHRFEVFDCSCCPPNITRFIASIGDFLYTHDENRVYVHQYMTSDATFELGGKPITITQTTNYPQSGNVKLVCSADAELALRIPAWCENWNIARNGDPAAYKPEGGYIVISCDAGDVLELSLEMTPTLVSAHPDLRDDNGRVALCYGPTVFCLEGVDNGENLHAVAIDPAAKFTLGFDETLAEPTLTTSDATRRIADESAPLYAKHAPTLAPATLKFIPYRAFANRGDTDMLVWVRMS